MERPRRGSGLGLLAVLLVIGVGGPARAVEWLGGGVELHGFYENQTRVIARNFDGNDDWDLTQWYQVLNLEFEFRIAPDGFGPFDLVTGYARLEGRFDCVWDRACHMFPSANTFGDRARHLPKRLSDSRYTGWTESQFTGDVRKRHGIPVDRLSIVYAVPPFGPTHFDDRVPMSVWNISGIDTLFGVDGPDGVKDTGDEPAPFILSEFLDFRFASRKVRGTENGVDTQVLGPWLPKNFVDGIGALSEKPNPFNPNDYNPTVLGANPLGADGVPDTFFASDAPFGSQARPFRPAPLITASPFVTAGVITHPSSNYDQQFARGIYYPNSELARLIRNDDIERPAQNFREAELKWNRGESQQQTHFLKEAYLDIELFDSSLWLRIGKQSIVWGKTELFRTTDQFNPQDVALATLPSLEESRIALWAFRAVWSLWQVGSFEDVRLELALNFDEFQGTDFGQCGEPYTVNAACNLRAGLFAHGIGGFGLAGETRPPDPWNDIKGLEVGFRAEWRWDRFSFALTDFYGYDDFPFADQLFRYERNVDPFSGRLRRNNSRGRCINDANNDGIDDEADNFGGVAATYEGNPDCLAGGTDALVNHHANQQLFAFVCSTSISFTDLDPTVCSQSVFNSSFAVSGAFPVNRVISSVLTGDATGVSLGNTLVQILANVNLTANNIPLVDLGLADFSGDTTLPDADGSPNNNETVNLFGANIYPHLDNHLTAAQRALLGCGPYLLFGTGANGRTCSRQGIDLLNAEASALTSAWLTQPGVKGTTYLNLTGPAPGTVPFYEQNGRFWCQRYVKGVGVVVLPGCHRPSETGYNAAIDGDPQAIGVNESEIMALFGGGAATIFNCANAASEAAGVVVGNGLAGGFCANGNPFTGEPWGSVMDAFSWNFQLLLVFFTVIGAEGFDEMADSSNPANPVNDDNFLSIDTLDPTDPLAPDKCSFIAPQYCENVSALLSVMGRRRNSLLAGGTSRYGRSDFTWHGGSSNRLKWQKRNVLGFSMDFAEDITKTNWSMETTWIHNLIVADNDALDGVAEVDQFNLTVSVDRPTFVNFLNQGRTLFINSQWFFRYTDGFNQSMPANGPWNVLFTLTVTTGWYQDRLSPNITSVYDFKSESGAVLPSLSYRFNESFSVEFGMAFFYGKWQSTRMPLTPVSLDDHVGSGAYREFGERGLALVRDRDEAYVILRKTF